MRLAIVVLVASCAGAAAPPAHPERKPIAFTYLGVAGWIIETDGKTIITDPYLTRPEDFEHVIFSDPDAVAKYAPKHADLVLVGHSHIDHLLDAPRMALLTGAQLMGSASTTRVGKASTVPPDHLIAITGGEDFELNGFSVRVIPSLHSAIGNKHDELGGEIPADPSVPMEMDMYREGGTFAYLLRAGGHEVLIFDTANFIEREVTGLHPDIAIIAPGLRAEIHDYTCRLLHAIGDPPIVIATHFDDWKKPAVDEPDSPDLVKFAAEVKACSPTTKLVIPKHFARFSL